MTRNGRSLGVPHLTAAHLASSINSLLRTGHHERCEVDRDEVVELLVEPCQIGQDARCQRFVMRQEHAVARRGHTRVRRRRRA
jgi:hypothetical protein